MNTDVHSNCSVHVMANIPLPVIIPNHTEQHKRRVPSVLHPESGCSLRTRLRAVPLGVKAGRTHKCHLKLTEQLSQLVVPDERQPISMPIPSGPSFPHMKWSLAPMCSITSTQTAQHGKLLKPWERKAEGRTAVSSLYFTLTPCAAFAHQRS